MRLKPYHLLAIALALGVAGWLAWRAGSGGGHAGGKAGEDSAASAPERELSAAPRPLRSSPRADPKAPLETRYTVERLSEEHEVPPRPEEWAELTRVLLRSQDDEQVAAVKARFALHAGAAALDRLIEAYDHPTNDDTRQRIIEVFSALHSPDFPEVARRILNDETLPISHHLVNACAWSLARRGEPADIEAILRRLNAAGEDPEPSGSLYSEADGLMAALSEADHPDLAGLLMSTAAGRGAAATDRARIAAAAALRHYPSVPVTQVLLDVSNHDPDPRVRRQAQRSLDHIRTPE